MDKIKFYTLFEVGNTSITKLNVLIWGLMRKIRNQRAEAHRILLFSGANVNTKFVPLF